MIRFAIRAAECVGVAEKSSLRRHTAVLAEAALRHDALASSFDREI